MARFDICRNTDKQSAKLYPYLLDVQSDLLGTIATRVVIPLARSAILKGKLAARLNPVLDINGEPYVLLTPELAGVPEKTLGLMVASAAGSGNEIMAALDLLFTGI